MLPYQIISHHTTSCHVASNSYSMALACHGASSERDRRQLHKQTGGLCGAIDISHFLCIGRFDPPMALAPATGLGIAVHCSRCMRSQALPLIRYIHREPSFGSDSGTIRSGGRTGVWHTVLACMCMRAQPCRSRTHMHVDARDRSAIRASG
ncbi:hypothetical protein EDB89DRAFT_698314 [Lactarius sanguifluus]|nr:hypothetical protein EDB89DRAFT_698314 [Lactarius sanguifluus]